MFMLDFNKLYVDNHLKRIQPNIILGVFCKIGNSMAYRSFRSYNYRDRLIRHQNFLGELSPIGMNSSNTDKMDATFDLEWVDESHSLVRLRSINFPRHYLRHQNFRVKLHEDNPADPLMRADSTFIAEQGLASPYGWEFISFRASNPNLPGHYIRHRNFHLYLDLIRPNDQIGREDATFEILYPAVTNFQPY
ncbi:AbfB domain-containing protein [Peribacillus frigoritolerans]|uniref:AbfB domain-containing protein n=1 Tax=Peribacillus frigoritolerans TaxID=450367 RepID=UPI00345D7952